MVAFSSHRMIVNQKECTKYGLDTGPKKKLLMNKLSPSLKGNEEVELLREALFLEIQKLLKQRDIAMRESVDPLSLSSRLLLFDAVLETALRAGFSNDDICAALALDDIRSFNNEN